jgi:hypothetical protein
LSLNFSLKLFLPYNILHYEFITNFVLPLLFFSLPFIVDADPGGCAIQCVASAAVHLLGLRVRIPPVGMDGSVL